MLTLVYGLAHADARIGFELESEKNRKNDVTNNSFTVAPGWQFSKDAPISRVEILLEGNQDNKGAKEVETKIGVRVRKDFEIAGPFSGYVRALIGRSFVTGGGSNYAYLEPAVKYKLDDKWSFTTSYRMIQNYDTDRTHVNKVRIGPNYDFDKHNWVELRYVRGYGDKDLSAFVFEYAYKF